MIVLLCLIIIKNNYKINYNNIAYLYSIFKYLNTTWTKYQRKIIKN